MILDATDLIVGRFCSVVAKKALLGEDISIVNSEKAVISGRRSMVLKDAAHEGSRGTQRYGPFIQRNADRLLRRKIRGMLPYKQEKGKLAYARVKCYVGVPPEFQGKKLETIEAAHLQKLPHVYYVTMGEISRLLGGKKQ